MSDRVQRVRELFQEALDLPTERRDAFLSDECGGDTELRAEVDGLLVALDDASGFLSESRAAAEEQVGAVIDRYRLIEPLGEGGFGVVWRAEQKEPFEREVALKVIKLGMDTRQIVRRFEAERQALARMDHPHIAAVYDAGTTPVGRPYFVMEFVRGVPITDYCRDRGLGVEERVGLLQKVALAVQHAHQKGVVHRDLKPGNILVTETNGEPVPKVIDFGVAKAIHADDDKTIVTSQGQILGTLEYMAPEQAAGDDLDVDTRTDVYGLGVVLYELLTGRRPFEVKDDPSAGTTGLLRRIRESQPTRPSSRIGLREEFMALPGADRSRWSRALRGDLDAIIQKALAKNPARRYPTPNSFANDLGRFLLGQPVDAGPPGTMYRVQRFVLRHRAAVGAAVLVFALLVGGVIATSLAWADAEQARKETDGAWQETKRAWEDAKDAEKEARAAEQAAKASAQKAQAAERKAKAASLKAETDARRARTALRALQELLASADPMLAPKGGYTLRELLDDFALGMETRFAGQADVAADLHVTVGAAYGSLGEHVAAERHLRRSVELSRNALGEDSQLFRKAFRHWTWSLRGLGRYKAALAAAQQCLALDEKRDPQSVATLRMLCTVADLHRLCGDTKRGEAFARRAEQLLPKHPKDRKHHAMCFDLLGAFTARRGEFDTATEYLKKAIALRTTPGQPATSMLANSLIELANIHTARREFDAAEERIERALEVQRARFGAEHGSVARSIAILAQVARVRRDYPRAEELATQALRMREKVLPKDHLDIGTSHGALGILAWIRKDLPVAEKHAREAMRIRALHLGPDDPSVHSEALNLGAILDRQGKPKAAEPLYRAALRVFRKAYGSADRRVADTLQNLGMAVSAQGRFAEAIGFQKESLALRQKHRPDDWRRIGANFSQLAWAYRKTGDQRGQAEAHEGLVPIDVRRYGADDERVAKTRTLCGQAWLACGEASKAKPHLEAAYAWCETHRPKSAQQGHIASMLVECRLADAKWDAAVDLARSSWQLLETARIPEQYRQEALRRLANALDRRAVYRDGQHDARGAKADRQDATAYRERLKRWTKK